MGQRFFLKYAQDAFRFDVVREKSAQLGLLYGGVPQKQLLLTASDFAIETMFLDVVTGGLSGYEMQRIKHIQSCQCAQGSYGSKFNLFEHTRNSKIPVWGFRTIYRNQWMVYPPARIERNLSKLGYDFVSSGAALSRHHDSQTVAWDNTGRRCPEKCHIHLQKRPGLLEFLGTCDLHEQLWVSESARPS